MKRKYKNEFNHFLFVLLSISLIFVIFRELRLKENIGYNLSASTMSKIQNTTTKPPGTSEIINAKMGTTLIGKISPEKINPNISTRSYISITQANRAMNDANKAISDAQLSQARAQARLDSQNAAILSSNNTMTNQFNQNSIDQQARAQTQDATRIAQEAIDNEKYLAGLGLLNLQNNFISQAATADATIKNMAMISGVPEFRYK